MPKRAISKKRAAEAEKEIDMDDKEATPVENIEGRLPPCLLYTSHTPTTSSVKTVCRNTSLSHW